MPVIINEFEVVPETAPPPREEGANRGREAEGAKKQERPGFEESLRLWRERSERVRAH